MNKSIVFILLLSLSVGCKTQSGQESAPFSVDEKTYFDWVGGKQGTKGVTIQITGSFQTTNLSFSKIFFQGHEYEVVPQFMGSTFILESTYTTFSGGDRQMSNAPGGEYGNPVPRVKSGIPFELEDDEAVILYSVNGREAFYKVTDIKKLDTVYRP